MNNIGGINLYQPLSLYITSLKKDFDSFCNKRLQEMGLSHGLMFFVIYIGNHPECSPKDLSTAIKADTGHTTRSVEKLVTAGFVTRKTKETDKRAFQLSLTEKGLNAFTEIKNLFTQWDEIALADISKEEKELLLKALSKLKKSSYPEQKIICKLSSY